MENQKPPRYTVTKEPHPDDAGEPTLPETQFDPVGNETLADVLRRVGGVAKAARRIIQGMDATLPQGWPDYRNRVYAALQVRDTCEGTPDKQKAPSKQDADARPAPGVLRVKAGK